MEGGRRRRVRGRRGEVGEGRKESGGRRVERGEGRWAHKIVSMLVEFHCN